RRKYQLAATALAYGKRHFDGDDGRLRRGHQAALRRPSPITPSSSTTCPSPCVRSCNSSPSALRSTLWTSSWTIRACSTGSHSCRPWRPGLAGALEPEAVVFDGITLLGGAPRWYDAGTLGFATTISASR